MKTLLITVSTILTLLFPQFLSAQSPTFEWAKRMGGIFQDRAYAIAIDGSGNVYTTGTFAATAHFDFEVDSITAVGSRDIFVQKLDPEGNLLWVKQMGGMSGEVGRSIAVDATGNVYITGEFYQTVDFDPGEETAFITSTGASDIFVLKLDTDGNFLWANKMGGSGGDYSFSLAVDAAGNVFTTGCFEQTANFDFNSETTTLTSIGESDIFVQKLDTDGNLLWVKQMGGVDWDQSNSIAVAASGDIYITGWFEGTADFDLEGGTATLTTIGVREIFVLKLDTDGNFIWVRQMEGAHWNSGTSIALDASANIYTTGNLRGSVDFDPGTGTEELTSAGESDIFVQKLDASGNFLWAKRMGGEETDSGLSVAVDAYGSVYTTGYFEGTADFDMESGEATLSSAGDDDIFVQKLDTDGNFIWVQQMGGSEQDWGTSIAVDAFGNIYTTGSFSESLDFDPGEETAYLISAGWTDSFVQKLSQADYIPVSITEAAYLFDHKVVGYPNPSSGIFNIQFEKPIDHATLTITDMQGKLISTTQIKNTSKTSIEINESPGVYLLTIKSKYGQKIIQLIKN